MTQVRRSHQSTTESPIPGASVTTIGKRGLTLRSVLIGLLLMPLVEWWVAIVEYVYCTLHPTLISLFATSIFTLAVLVALNESVRRIRSGWALCQAELITIYVMLNIGTALVSHHCLQVLVSSIPYANHFANSYNNWGPLFANKLPWWLVVRDPVSLKNFYQGGNLYDPVNWVPWVAPVLCWTAFILVLSGMFLCINVLLRKQWTARERLAYPLVQLPLDMTVPGSPLFRNRLFWIGFGLVAAIDLINGLSALYPSIPRIPIKATYELLKPATRPWNSLGWLPAMFYPFGIGLGMLLPVDMLFSSWFFFWVWKAQNVLTAAFGLDSIPRMPFSGQQSLGAYIGICCFSLFTARSYLRSLARRFLGKPCDLDDSDEGISYRAAMWCLVFGFVFLVGFCVMAGMSIWLAALFFLVYLAISVAVTRMRAELGLPAHDLERSGPDATLAAVIGPRELGTANLAGLSMLQWFNRGYQSHSMPIQLEGFKMAEVVRSGNRAMLKAICTATAAGTVIGFWVLLSTTYKLGGATSKFWWPDCPIHLGSEPWNRMESWVLSPAAPSAGQAIAMAVGFCVVVLLNSLRMRLSWFPFHPVGYAVSASWSMHVLWLPMFIAWAIKLCILSYGGLKMYRKALPLFMGFIIAECVVGGAWTIFGAITRLPSYRFFP